MNRLVIIGNGFDLAHGLPTSYGSFLNWIWKNVNKGSDIPFIKNIFEINSTDFIITEDLSCYHDFHQYVTKKYSFGAYKIEQRSGRTVSKVYYQETVHHSHKVVFSFKNKLFELINIKNTENWVDIEYIYYSCLISIVKDEKTFAQITSVHQLNEELLQIKQLLSYYLQNEIEDKFIFDKSYYRTESVVDLFEYNYSYLENRPHNDIFLEFPANYKNKLIEFDNLFAEDKDMNKNDAFETMFLDFNYTSNVANYIEILHSRGKRGYGAPFHIQIHGKLNSKDNPINFGFGDEMDDHYKVLEKTGDNNYLENIKSFMYFNNTNYRNLLNWIESDDFQIFIMGHSCGLSDRTLLNTLFEHNNCKSIKVYYHLKDNGSDNFTELSQNISRHFNKKSMMREKVVPKSLSKPLPQNVRYNVK